MAIPKISLILAQKKTIARDVLELHFVRPAGFIFVAGQFLQFLVPTEEGEVMRSYSIASSPDEEQLVFVVKLMPQGKASTLFAAMQLGDTVMARGPFGRFTVAASAGNKIFISTSTGLAPFISMARSPFTVRSSEIKKESIFLLAGFRTEADIFYQDKLTELKKQNPNFDFAITLSQPSDSWTDLRGRVTAHLSTLNFQLSTHFFLCGNGNMIKDMTHLLTAQDVAHEQIHFEVFF